MGFQKTRAAKRKNIKGSIYELRLLIVLKSQRSQVFFFPVNFVKFSEQLTEKLRVTASILHAH